MKSQAKQVVAKIRKDAAATISRYEIQIAQLESDKGALIAAIERQITNGIDYVTNVSRDKLKLLRRRTTNC
jgi:citrate lyase gamma subunit